MNEIWKDIEGYEGRYQVSDRGVVKSVPFKQRYLLRNKKEAFRLKKSKVISQQLTNSGYLLVHLHKNSKRKAFTVHTLVARAFLTGTGEVNHKDGDKTNNKIANLEYVTSSENKTHAVLIGLNATAKRVKGTPEKGGETVIFPSIAGASLAVCGRRNGGSHISKCLKGKRRIAYGHFWEYV